MIKSNLNLKLRSRLKILSTSLVFTFLLSTGFIGQNVYGQDTQYSLLPTSNISLLDNIITQKLSVDDVIKKTRQASVYIEMNVGNSQLMTGSGFVINNGDNKDLVVTCQHVVEKNLNSLNGSKVIFSNGKSYLIEKILIQDKTKDLAVLQIQNNGDVLPNLELGDSSTISRGDEVIVVSSPHQQQDTLTSGEIIDFGMNSIRNGFDIVHNASISAGSSGSEVVCIDENSINYGKIIGVNYAVNDNAVKRYMSIGVNDLKALLNSDTIVSNPNNSNTDGQDPIVITPPNDNVEKYDESPVVTGDSSQDEFYAFLPIKYRHYLYDTIKDLNPNTIKITKESKYKSTMTIIKNDQTVGFSDKFSCEISYNSLLKTFSFAFYNNTQLNQIQGKQFMSNIEKLVSKKKAVQIFPQILSGINSVATKINQDPKQFLKDIDSKTKHEYINSKEFNSYGRVETNLMLNYGIMSYKINIVINN